MPKRKKIEVKGKENRSKRKEIEEEKENWNTANDAQCFPSLYWPGVTPQRACSPDAERYRPGAFRLWAFCFLSCAFWPLTRLPTRVWSSRNVRHTFSSYTASSRSLPHNSNNKKPAKADPFAGSGIAAKKSCLRISANAVRNSSFLGAVNKKERRRAESNARRRRR